MTETVTPRLIKGLTRCCCTSIKFVSAFSTCPCNFTSSINQTIKSPRLELNLSTRTSFFKKKKEVSVPLTPTLRSFLDPKHAGSSLKTTWLICRGNYVFIARNFGQLPLATDLAREKEREPRCRRPTAGCAAFIRFQVGGRLAFFEATKPSG